MDLAVFLGDIFVWIWEYPIKGLFGGIFGKSIEAFGALGGITVVLIGGWIIWRVGLAVAPLKICWRCKGVGHYKVGFFFGRRLCGWCAGTGTRSRTGATRD